MEIVLLLVAVCGWLIVRSMDREELRQRLSTQDDEIRRLREIVAEMRRPAAPVAAAPKVDVTPAAAAPAKTESVPEEVTIQPVTYRPPVVAPAPPFRPAAPVAPPPVARVEAPRPVMPPVVPPPPPVREPSVAVAMEANGQPEKRSLEQTLGVAWASRLGIVLVVFGVAFGLYWEVARLGPLGKVLMAYAASAVLLGGGLWLERKERFKLFARAGIGGGWALAFLTTYAMYFFPATQVLPSQALDLVLLFGVGVGMVAHSLRYRSQVVTGLAFLLAFSTVTISQVSAFSLLASAVLALGLEYVCVREEWYGLEVAGVIAAYGNHFLWLDRTLDLNGGPGHPFALWGQSTALLLLFWAIFRVGYCLRKPSSVAGEGMSGLVAVLNSVGVLMLMKYQSFHPEYAFRALLALGTVEMALAFWMRGRRRPAFAVLVTIASVLLVAAIPFRYSGVTWPLVWVLEGEALFVCGVLLRERLMRWLGIAVHLLVVGQMTVMHGAVVFDARAAGWGQIATTFFVVAAAMWVNAEWLGLRNQNAEQSESEAMPPYRAALVLCSFAAAACALAGFAILIPGWTLALVWAGLALVLLEAGLRTKSLALRVEGYAVLLAALARLLAFNFFAPGKAGFGDTRLWAGFGVMAAFVLVHARLRGQDREEAGAVSAAATWFGSGLAMWLLYLEVADPWLAVAWAGLALVLLEVGLREPSLGPRLQSYGVLAGSIGWLVLVNFMGAGQRGFGDPRLWAGVGLIAACVAVHLRLRASQTMVEERVGVSGAVTWCASALAMGLLYLEVPEHWLAVAWAGLALLLLEAGLRERTLAPRLQAYAALAGAMAWLVLVNFGHGGTAGWGDFRLWAGVGVIAGCVLMYERLSLAGEAVPAEERSRVMGAAMWCASALVSTLMYMELPEMWLAAGWAGFGLALAGAALLRDGARLRSKALLLALMAAGRGLVVNLAPVFLANDATHDWGHDWNRLAFFSAVALLAAGVPVGLMLCRRPMPEGRAMLGMSWLLGHPQQVFFFSALALLVAWVPADLHQGAVTIGWSVLGVAVFLLALAAGERSFRLSGLGLLVLGVAKLLIVDVWGLPPTAKYPLLIGVGVALIVVSALYSRFGERLKEYL